jgi:hypothetical protein
MSARRPALATMLRAAAVAGAVAAALGAGLAVAGPFGLAVAAESAAALALVIALAWTPGGAHERRALRPGTAWAWATRGRHWRRRLPEGTAAAGDFPVFAKISSDLVWAPVSQWHYDHGIRPLLIRLLGSALAERHRVDLRAEPARARQLAGEDIWPLVDPARPPSFDSKSPGPDLRALARVVDRLERL